MSAKKKKTIITLPAYLGEPDTITLKKVAGKIGEYEFDPADNDVICASGKCFCDCSCACDCEGDCKDYREPIEMKMDELITLVTTKFGEIDKILKKIILKK